MCASFCGSFMGVGTYADMFAFSEAKFVKTVGLLEKNPEKHMECYSSATDAFRGVLASILGSVLPAAWTAERVTIQNAYLPLVADETAAAEAEAKAEATRVSRAKPAVRAAFILGFTGLPLQ